MPKGQLILIVTQDRRRGERLERHLTDHGYRCDQAASLQDAVKAVKLEQPRVVVTDLWIGDSPAQLVVTGLRKFSPASEFIGIQLDATQNQYALNAVESGMYLVVSALLPEQNVVTAVGRAIERGRSRTDLVEVQERLALLFNRVETGILVVDAENGQIVDANPAATRQLGLSREALTQTAFAAVQKSSRTPPAVTDLAEVSMGGRRLILKGITSDARRVQLEHAVAAMRTLSGGLMAAGTDLHVSLYRDGVIAEVFQGGAYAGGRLKPDRPVQDVFPEAHRASIRAAIGSVFETGATRHLTANAAGQLPVDITLTPVRHEDVVILALMTAKDPSARGRDERRQSLRDAATECASFGFMLVDEQGAILDVNQELCDMLDQSRSGLVGSLYWQLIPEGEAAAWSENWDQVQLQLNFQKEVTLQSAHGIPVPVNLTVHALSWQGDTYAAVFAENLKADRELDRIAHDFKLHEQALLNFIQDSVVTVDRAGVIHEANTAARKMLGIPRGALEGRNLYDLLPENVQQGRRTRIMDTFIQGKSVEFEDSDDTYSYEHHLIPLRDARGIVSEVMSISRIIWVPQDRGTARVGARDTAPQRADLRARRQLLHDLQEDLLPRVGDIRKLGDSIANEVSETSTFDPESLSELQDRIARCCEALEGLVDIYRPASAASGGLVAAMTDLAKNAQRQWSVDCQCNLSTGGLIHEDERVSHLVELAREALRHAVLDRGASRARIEVKSTRRNLLLKITDNGTLETEGAVGGVATSIMAAIAHAMGSALETSGNAEGGLTVQCTLDL